MDWSLCGMWCNRSYLFRAATELRTAWNLPHFLQEMNVYFGVAEQECDEQLISNIIDDQRPAPEYRGRNLCLLMKASLIRFDNWLYTCIHHCSNSFLVFLLERQNYMESENKTALRWRMCAILSSGAKMTKFGVPPGGDDLIVSWVCCSRRWNSSATCGRPSTDRSLTYGRGTELLSVTPQVSA
jgi:hypothetical protein